MTDNKKPHTAGTGTASNNTIDKPNSTSANPLAGWFSLAAGVKPSRSDRTVKKSWKRGRK